MSPLTKNRFTIHTFYKLIVLIVFVGGIIWYSLFQARSLIDGPMIIITEPTSDIHYDKTITIKGETENITAITLNGRSITTDEQGYFEEMLVLENGYTIMTLTSEDRFGRTTSVSRSFVYISEEETNN